MTRRRVAPVIAGVDASLTNTRVAVVPSDWASDWSRWRVSDAIGYDLPSGVTKLQDRLNRIGTVVEAVRRFCLVNLASEIWVEGYAYNRRFQAHQLGELGGVLRYELTRQYVEQLGARGLEVVREAPLASIRTQLLGSKRLKGDIKQQVRRRLKAAGCPWEQHDELDAIAAANYGLAQLGVYPFGGS